MTTLAIILACLAVAFSIFAAGVLIGAVLRGTPTREQQSDDDDEQWRAVSGRADLERNAVRAGGPK